MSDVPTTAQLRDAIDSGVTGEKVGHPDPAAAPLGTDAEAGGNPPTRQERALDAATQTTMREPVQLNGPLIYAGCFVVLAAAILLILNLA